MDAMPCVVSISRKWMREEGANKKQGFDDLPDKKDKAKNDKVSYVPLWSWSAATLNAMRHLTETVLRDVYSSAR